uniref:Uncharacterized protein n=1 Tax=Panagrolaimus superbus TaxID=310955 RepID=A0A914Y436_9BILA
MLRGRCFQLKDFYQRDPDEVGKLALYLNQIPSPLIDPRNIEAQLVVYISDKFPDIATFPRFYLNFLQWNRMRFNLKEIDMLPSIGQCDSGSQGRATCFVNNWLKYKVIEQYNCSVFYLQHKRPDIQICDPEIIIKNYDTFVDPSLKDYECVPPCLRFDTAIEIYTAMEMTGPQGAIDSGTAAFRIEASYISLEVSVGYIRSDMDI